MLHRDSLPYYSFNRDRTVSASASLASPARQTSANAFRWNFLIRSQLDNQLQFHSGSDVETRRTLKMAKVEAVLFVADSALSTRKIAQLATLANASEAKELIDQLNAALEATHSAFHIKRVATGYQMMTQPQFSFWLNKLHQRQAALKLSSPAMETLAIVVYRQPITRADIESIRGVQSAEMLKQLMDRGLVRIGGKDDSLGRPFLYESTRKFLEIFGLKNLDDLPMGETLRIRPEKPGQPVAETEEETDLESAVEEVSEEHETAEIAEDADDDLSAA
ncbi:MAG: SMC-Scp complex subunit ScpB [Gimesia sp.]|jgi:segregation and condensation protein B|uniref:SMC-Scp complex subunit ScpB n=1 Tax=Gimesia maris TaxID=122 RepID=A0A3D3QZV5_9PLAN|nr:SMC-Scp complex subunit ScpB [Gimesia sp.]HCO22123.1 SMC-Scp complex subunit ScpB [Gimesia maris]|tara:strand:+ start:71452 stop:72285 length:834 start_codon:yes stop_codon:yes gene_type:complete